VQALLKADPKLVDALDDGIRPRETPLYYALENGSEEVARILLDHGARVNHQNWELETPLHRAVKQGNLGMAKLLLEAKADVSRRKVDWNSDLDVPYFWTPLHSAAAKGDAPMIELLIRYKADVRAKDTRGLTPLEWWHRSDSHPAAQARRLFEFATDEAFSAPQRAKNRIVEILRRVRPHSPGR
jgi:hypothetical protein